jgi:5'-nucleotidase
VDRPLILLSNDDGIHAAGIRSLAEALADLGDVIVVAPDRERSAQSHAFTLDRPLRCDEIRKGWHMVDGTPADCMYIGILKICGRKPDLVVSGINHGFNLGSDVFYSGTVAAAVEAAIRDVPAIAMSLDAGHRSKHPEGELDPFRPAARFAHALSAAVLREGLPLGTLLNVNVPRSAKLKGFRWTRLGKRLYRDQVDERADLRGRHYYWIGGPAIAHGDTPGSDCNAIDSGYVSVSPLDLDLTHAGLLEKLPGWHVEGFTQAVTEDLSP